MHRSMLTVGLPHSADLSDAEKTDYIDAVRCLMTKPSITPPEVVPGARTRYDDFVATHMNLTQTIHLTGNFLTWHRYQKPRLLCCSV